MRGRKALIALVMVAIIAGSIFFAIGQSNYALRPYVVYFFDENGQQITSGLTVTILSSGSTATVYSNENSTSLTNPITSTVFGTNTGQVKWYGDQTSYVVRVDDGTNIFEFTVTTRTHKIVLPIYLATTKEISLASFMSLHLPTATAVSVTSPTVTFDASEKFRITLASDANQTGFYPTGGELNQVLLIESYGTGSNTMRFDDGTSMTIGANATLTESQGDVLCLICTSADGDEWRELFLADN